MMLIHLSTIAARLLHSKNCGHGRETSEDG